MSAEREIDEDRRKRSIGRRIGERRTSNDAAHADEQRDESAGNRRRGPAERRSA